jgi:hypothetical protein
MRLTAGLSLLKIDGIYTQYENPDAELLDAASVAYLGGHVYPVWNTEAAFLAAAGYGAYLDPPFTGSGYGAGAYGAGAYGENEVASEAYGAGLYGTGPYGGN